MKIHKTISLLILALVLVVQSGAQAQNTSAQSGIKARARGTKLILTSQGKRHTLDVSKNVDAARLDEVSVLFATRRQDFLYLLVDACGSSNLTSSDRQCGAGQECNLLWIKLNVTWQIKDIKATRYESCWAPISSYDTFHITGNTLQFAYSDLREDKDYKVTYDADKPEDGFHLEGSAAKSKE